MWTSMSSTSLDIKRKHFSGILPSSKTHTTNFIMPTKNLPRPKRVKKTSGRLCFSLGFAPWRVKYRSWKTKEPPDNWTQFKHFCRGLPFYCGREAWADAVCSEGWWLRGSPAHSSHPHCVWCAGNPRAKVGIVGFCKPQLCWTFPCVSFWPFTFEFF